VVSDSILVATAGGLVIVVTDTVVDNEISTHLGKYKYLPEQARIMLWIRLLT
jgi:hypothetical protein